MLLFIRRLPDEITLAATSLTYYLTKTFVYSCFYVCFGIGVASLGVEYYFLASITEAMLAVLLINSSPNFGVTVSGASLNSIYDWLYLISVTLLSALLLIKFRLTAYTGRN